MIQGLSAGKLQYVWTHPGNQDSRVRALVRSASFLSWHRIARKPMTVALGERSRIVGYPDSYGGASAVYGNPGPDHLEIALWRSIVRPGDTVFDVGANEGLYTVLFAEMGAHVVAFEPDPRAAHRLRENLRLNAYSADVREQAVYSSTGLISFTSHLDTSNAIVDGGTADSSVHTVPTTTIDEVLGKRHARGIKVDVEGAELDVLIGAQQAMRDARIDVFQLEWNDMSSNFGTTRDEIAEYVRSFGYELYRPTADGDWAPTSSDIGTDVFAVRRGFDRTE